MAATVFCELQSDGLIAATGADAVAFLQAQLTSDVAGMIAPQTQYSGYCSPKGRLLATCLIWRDHEEIVLQLPRTLREALHARLSKYVLRARVSLADATQTYRLFGVAGAKAQDAIASFSAPPPQATHEVVSIPGIRVTRLPVDRYMVLAHEEHADRVHTALAACTAQCPATDWVRTDIEAGIAIVTPLTQEEYVPQMVNLDLIGGVSYSKGCYPGQEIVARMHYLGRLKQRMYRIHIPVTQMPLPGDALYSHAFGPDQASGAIINAAPVQGAGCEALAVIQTVSAAQGSVHWKSLDGPALDFLPLPYKIPG